jgi:photosystem II stability/assembly factor-like uncharacterized protein
MSIPLRLRLVLILTLLLPWAAFAADRWQPAGPEGGNVTALVIDPANPRVLYAGVGAGGVFKSVDAGATWNPAFEGLAGNAVLALAQVPQTAGTLYAGTSHGVFKTTDGGAHWAAASAGSSPAANGVVDTLVVTPSAIYAGVSESLSPGPAPGLFKSVNGGVNWSQLDLGRDGVVVTALAADPTNPRVLYAGIKEIGPLAEIGVLRSGDAGATWSFSARGLPKGTIQDLAIHPAAPRTVYAAIGGAGVFRSDDGGGLWKNVSRGLTNPLVTALAVGPAPGTLYAAALQGTAATGSLFRTANGGARWQRADRGLPFDLQEVAVDPRGTVLYAGSASAGVFRGVNAGATWAPIDRGLRAVATDAVLADPRRPAILYAGTPDFGLIKSVNGGASWNAPGAGAGARKPLAIDPGQPATVYASGRDGKLLRSRNGGRSWQAIDSLPVQSLADGVNGLVLDPNDPSILYAVRPREIDRSADGGNTWTRELTTTCVTLAYPAITPASRVYVAAVSMCGPTLAGGGILMRDDTGEWRAVEVDVNLLYPTPTALAADPRQPSTLYTGVSGLLIEPPANVSQIFRTTDGVTWSPVALSGSLGPATAFTFLPAEPGVVYAAIRGQGIYVSEDDGETWRAAINAGLPSYSIPALAVSADSSTVYAATAGGLYKLTRTP